MNIPSETETGSNSSAPLENSRLIEDSPAVKANAPARKPFHISAWVAIIGLLLVLSFVIVRNAQNGQEPGIREETRLAEGLISAMSQTKLAYLALREPDPSFESVKKPASPPAKKKKYFVKSPLNFADSSLKEWRKLAASSQTSPGIWRRYAISLFLFNRPGGMEAFQHITDAPKPEDSKIKLTPLQLKRKTASRESSHPFPAIEELEIWKSIYGSDKIDPARFPELQYKISKLNLGWFENIVLASLNRKAGRIPEARFAARSARVSCERLSMMDSFQIGMAIIGFFLLAAYLLFSAVMKLAKSQEVVSANSPAQTSFSSFDGIPQVNEFKQDTKSAAPTRNNSNSSENSVSNAVFSYRTLSISFLIYYVSFLLIALPVRLFSPLFMHLADASLHRLTLILGLILYVPVVALTLWSLQYMTERELKRKVPMREIWKGLGFRFDQIGRDFGRAAAGYIMLYPLIAIAGLLSIWVFETLLKRYHFFTPINPAEIESMISINFLDQLLLAMQAVVAAPIVEELMFRGLLFNGLRSRWGFVIGAVVSSAIFAHSHHTLPNGFLTLWTIGMGLCCVSVQRGRNSALPNIFMHAIHNGLITLMMIFVFAK